MPVILVDLMTWLGIGTAASAATGVFNSGSKAVSGTSNLVKYGAIAVGAIVLIKILK